MGEDAQTGSTDDRSKWQIKALRMEAEARPVDIPEAGVTIGRAPSNGIVLVSDEFPGVSGTHVRVVVRDGKVIVEDLDSKNGTFVQSEKITRATMAHGDVFELGRGGPRFVVLNPGGVNQTTVLGDLPKRRRTMGAETVEVMREKLGIPAFTPVTDVVRDHHRRNTVLIVLGLLAVVVGGLYGFSWLQEEGRGVAAQLQRIDEELANARDSFERHRNDWKNWEDKIAAIDTASKEAWKAQKESLRVDRKKLEARLADSVSASAAELAGFKKKISSIDWLLGRDEARRSVVKNVTGAVVMIEVKQTFEESKSGRKLYLSDAKGPNVKKIGKLYTQDSTGSGFCISRDGWIVTNAHVILEKRAKKKLTLGSLTLHSKVALHVVFSGTSRRLEAKVHAYAASGSKDLALIKIEEFEGMPHLGGIDTNQERAPQGTQVYLLGFPLGEEALHEGKTMIASVFRGIVSRSVRSYLQVDAAVHSGNSGGPVIDDTGRVIGIVLGMQRINDEEAAPDMGYIIPIGAARDVWPPKH